MNWSKGVFQFYKRSMQQAVRYFINNPIFMVIGAVILIVVFLVSFVASGLPLFGYLISALVQSAGYSSYLFMIYRASLGYQVDWQDAKRGVYVYTRVIMGIIMLSNFIIIIMLSYLRLPSYILLIYLLALTLLVNTLPEVIANKQYFVIESIKYCFDFEKRHLVLWYLPNLLFAFLFVIVQNFLLVGVASFQGDGSIKKALLIVVMLLVFQFIGGIIMIFRQILFRSLDSGEYKRYFRNTKKVL